MDIEPKIIQVINDSIMIPFLKKNDMVEFDCSDDDCIKIRRI